MWDGPDSFMHDPTSIGVRRAKRDDVVLARLADRRLDGCVQAHRLAEDGVKVRQGRELFDGGHVGRDAQQLFAELALDLGGFGECV